MRTETVLAVQAGCTGLQVGGVINALTYGWPSWVVLMYLAFSAWCGWYAYRTWREVTS